MGATHDRAFSHAAVRGARTSNIGRGEGLTRSCEGVRTEPIVWFGLVCYVSGCVAGRSRRSEILSGVCDRKCMRRGMLMRVISAPVLARLCVTLVRARRCSCARWCAGWGMKVRSHVRSRVAVKHVRAVLHAAMGMGRMVVRTGLHNLSCAVLCAAM